MNEPFLLGGLPAVPCDPAAARAAAADVTEASFDEGVGRWVAPFGMAKINTRVVRRSASLGAYGGAPGEVLCEGFTYQEVSLAPSEAAAAKMAKNAAIPATMLKKLVESGRLPSPSNGPNAEQRASSSFLAVFVAEGGGDGGGPLRATSAVGGGDPGYNETAKMVSESALALIEGDRGALACGGAGGVWTPAAGLGDPLVARLRRAGMRLDTGGYDLGALPCAL